MKNGKIIFLNGTSSSGKTTVAKELQNMLDEVYLYFSIDNYLNNLPSKFTGTYDDFNKVMSEQGSNIIKGFHRMLTAVAKEGNNIILDHLLESETIVRDCQKAFKDIDVLIVGLRCSLEEAERRESERPDRRKGQARSQYEIIHSYGEYDLEIDTTSAPIKDNTEKIKEFISLGKHTNMFWSW